MILQSTVCYTYHIYIQYTVHTYFTVSVKTFSLGNFRIQICSGRGFSLVNTFHQLM